MLCMEKWPVGKVPGGFDLDILKFFLLKMELYTAKVIFVP